MPYIDFTIANCITPEKMEHLKAGAAAIMERHAGKGENWLYVRVAGDEKLYFQGRAVTNGGVVEVKLVGSLSGTQKKEITGEICRLLEQELQTASNQVYVIFTEVKGENWGWNGQTFG